MARLTLRVARLERRTGAVGPCPVCKGAGRDGFVCRASNEPEERPFGGCPRCGAFRTVYTKIINMGPDFDYNAAFPPLVQAPAAEAPAR